MSYIPYVLNHHTKVQNYETLHAKLPGFPADLLAVLSQRKCDRSLVGRLVENGANPWKRGPFEGHFELSNSVPRKKREQCRFLLISE